MSATKALVRRPKSAVAELPPVVEFSSVLDERTAGIVAKKESKLSKLQNTATAIERSAERLRKRIAENEDVRQLKQLEKSLKTVKSAMHEQAVSISVTIEDALVEVPGETLIEKIQFLHKQSLTGAL